MIITPNSKQEGREAQCRALIYKPFAALYSNR